MRRAQCRTVSVLMMVLVSLGLTGCSMSSDGQAEPTAGESSEGASAPPSGSGAAPKVTNPLDARELKQDPCGLLTAGQTNELFGREVKGQRRVGQLGPACTFGNLFREPWVNFEATLPDRTSLNVLYQQRERFAKFDPIESIVGYPAVVNMLYDLSDRGECTLDVGVNDEQSLTIQVKVGKGSNYGKPCGVAAEVAKQMVQTLKARS